MWMNKILFLLSAALFLTKPAFGDEGRFSLIPKGGTISYDAICFDDIATAKLLTFKEFVEIEYKKKCEFEKSELQISLLKEQDILFIQLEENKNRFEIQLNALQEENGLLREKISKTTKVNLPVAIVVSTAVGFSIGFGSYYIASK